MIDLNDNLNIKTPKPIRPIDIIGVGCLYLTKEDIPANVRYDGLQVYVLSNNVNYQLNGGITDSDWVIIASSNTTVPYTLDVRRLLQSNNGNSIFIGEGAGENDDLTDNKNIFIGNATGNDNISGNGNVAVGYNSLKTNVTGNDNTAIGYHSLLSLLSGNNNVAIGYNPMRNTTGSNHNIAIGDSALYFTTGGYNIAIGYFSMLANLLGSYNLAIGYRSLSHNTSGINNLSIGYESLKDNTEGNYNTAFGQSSLGGVLIGEFNIGIGVTAGMFIEEGYTKNTNPTGCIYIGHSSRSGGASSIKEVVIGADAIGNGSNTATILDDNGTDVWMGENGQCIVHAKATQTTLLSGALSNPPTKAEIEALGISVTVGSGYEVNVWDTANSIMYNINTDGTDCFYVAKTKAL